MFYTMQTLTVFELMPLFLLRLPLAYIPVEKVGQALAECNMGCPFSKLVVSSPIDLVNCLYSCHILYLWHTFLMGHTANF